MIRTIKSVLISVLASIEHNLYLLLITTGMFFTTVQYAGQEYSYMVFSSLTNKNFSIAILFPCCILVTFQTLKYINTSTNLVIRMDNRKNLLKNILLSVFIITLIFFLEVIIISLIVGNITSHQSFSLTNYFGYGVYDIIIMGIALSRTYFTILSISFLGVCLNLYFKNKTYAVVITLLFSISLYFLSNLITGNIFIDLINPGFNFEGHYFTNSIYDLLISGLIYFGSFYSVLIFFMNRNINRKEIGI